MGFPFRGILGALINTLLGAPTARRLLARVWPLRYTIRGVDTVGDVEGITALAAKLSQSPPGALREGFLREFASRDPRRWLFLVAVDRSGGGRNVLGFVRATRQGPEQHWWVAGLGVRPLCRGRGIGEHLMREALARLRALGVCEVRLTVNRASRAAIALYRKLGFEEERQAVGQQTANGIQRMILSLGRATGSG